MSLIDPYGPDFLVNLAASLTFKLMENAGRYLQRAAFGPPETQALDAAWQAAFAHMLAETAGHLPPERATLLGEVFQAFIDCEGVADDLVALALVGQTPPLADLARRFDALEFDRDTLEVNFPQALAALAAGLAEGLLDQATQPGSPLHNRVHLVRLLAVQQLLAQQQASLAAVAGQLARLESQLQASQGKYSLVFLGPASGFAVGDGATTKVEAEMRPLLEQVLAAITRLAAAAQPPPYSADDQAGYLQAVVGECDTIELPYAADGGLASLPLRQIYAALKADRSSPVERKASHTFFQKLVRQAGGDGRFIDDDLIYQVARLDPYAARFLMYDPRMPAQLRAAHQAEEERTFDMAEILCRHRWLVLLGDPGSGKSTLARWLALHLAQALQQGLDRVRVPAGHVRPGRKRTRRFPWGRPGCRS